MDIKELYLSGKIRQYEETLIQNLRGKYYYGIPLSIYLNSKVLCNGSCHHMAFQLSRGMNQFQIINGNVNCFEPEPNGNHSWVKSSDWIYDTTSGLKWKEEIYKEIYQPTIIEEYNENNWQECWFYRKELNYSSKGSNETVNLIIELIKIIETEQPHVNLNRLLKEIYIYRKQENIIEQISKEIVDEYRQRIYDNIEGERKKLLKMIEKQKIV